MLQRSSFTRMWQLEWGWMSMRNELCFYRTSSRWISAKPYFARWTHLLLPFLEIWLLEFRWSCSYIVALFIAEILLKVPGAVVDIRPGLALPCLILIHNSLSHFPSYSLPCKVKFSTSVCWFHEVENRNCCKARSVWTLEHLILPNSTLCSCPLTNPTYTACIRYQKAGNLLETGFDRAFYVLQIGPPPSHFIYKTAWRTWYVNCISFSQEECRLGDRCKFTQTTNYIHPNICNTRSAKMTVS